MDLATSVAVASAGATTVSAFFIAWQALETRRSAASSNKSAEASEAALTVANASLELNRRQAEQSAFMVVEATRARLETNAPAVSMQLIDGYDAVPGAFIVGKSSQRSEFKVAEIGQLFQRPQDAELCIYALFDVVFHNDGLVPVTVLSQSTVTPTSGDFVVWTDSFRVEVGGSVDMQLAVGASLKGWTHFLDRKMDSRGEAGWITELSGDSGVRLTQKIHIDGTVLTPGQREGDFRLRGYGPDENYPAYILDELPKRTYWLGGKEISALSPGDVFGADEPGISQ